jgi:hypothetical protein
MCLLFISYTESLKSCADRRVTCKRTAPFFSLPSPKMKRSASAQASTSSLFQSVALLVVSWLCRVFSLVWFSVVVVSCALPCLVFVCLLASCLVFLASVVPCLSCVFWRHIVSCPVVSCLVLSCLVFLLFLLPFGCLFRVCSLSFCVCAVVRIVSCLLIVCVLCRGPSVPLFRPIVNWKSCKCDTWLSI